MKTTSLQLSKMALSLIFAGIAAQARADGREHERRDRPDERAQIEPDAGNWRTWVISSGKDYRVPPPPGHRETKAELRALAELMSRNDAQVQRQIAFWDAGTPAYRWIDMINARVLAGKPISFRAYPYVALAMYDATIATWESKYFYNRPRPSEREHDLPTELPVPNSPSYPSEHAAAAQAAAAVLAYFLPEEAQSFQTMAEQAGWSRVLAVFNIPATTTLDSNSGGELPNGSSQKRRRTARMQFGRVASRLARVNGSAPIPAMSRAGAGNLCS